MKKQYTLISALALVLGICSCAPEEFSQNHYIENGDKVRLILTAERGESVSSPETRVYVGETSGGQNGASGSVRYHWNTSDRIGVLPLNLGTNASPNYESPLTEIMGDKNYAQFETYFTAEGFDATTNPQLLIYYPYNSSMLQGVSGSTGASYASSGLTFRLPNMQEQYGYNLKLNETDHPSVSAVSNYGLAYDLASSNVVADGGENEVTATGGFRLDHANTYFQFNVFGGQRTIFHEDGSSSEGSYANDGWKISSVNVEIGNCVVSSTTVDGKTEAVYTMTKQIPIAGTYKFSYKYSASHFTDGVSGYDNNDKIELESVAPLNVVQVNMRNIEKAPELGDNVNAAVPAFVVINGQRISSPVTGDETNCMKVSVTAYKYDSDGKIEGSDTRIRYFNIEKLLKTDVSGDYYTIPFEFCDPVESYTDLAVPSTSNSYIISAPGNYTFNIDIAGNGKKPYGGFTAGITDPTDLMEDGQKYGFDWLWASGPSFDQVAKSNPSFNDTQIVKEILNNVEISGETGRVSIGLATGTTESLSGNIVVALYKTNDNGTEIGDIVWTWHIWLGQPQNQHYKFKATTTKYSYDNEDWYMLDRNLGAETTDIDDPRSAGLYYQRGRKEPIIGYNQNDGSTSWKNNQLPTYRNTAKFGNIATWEAGVSYDNNYNTIKYPMWLMTGQSYSSTSAHYYYAWNASTVAGTDTDDVSNDTKSMFDPCPAGYRLPTTREWDNMKNDIYIYSGGTMQGSGVFGYCVWKDAELASNERGENYAARIAGGDFYELNDQMERTYTITANSGTGAPITTTFPTTGVLHGDGTWKYLYQGSWNATTPAVTVNHPAGPDVSAAINDVKTTIPAGPELTTSISSSTLTVNFTTDADEYYYATSSTGSKNTISNRGTINLSRLSYSNNRSTLYFYVKDNNGGYSAATTVIITRSGRFSYSYSAGEPSPGSASETTLSTLNITFKDGVATYYYAFGSNSTKSAVSNTDALSIPCSDITVSGGSRTVYLYAMNNEGNYSAATTVRVNYSDNAYTLGTITRGAAYTETLGGETETNSDESTMILWSAGRVDGSTYYPYWFGPGYANIDSWANSDGTSTGGSSPYDSEGRETYTFVYGPYAIGAYNNYINNCPAAPMRCIREYDNVATANE